MTALDPARSATVARNIRAARKKSGWTTRQLGEVIGKSRGVMSHLEGGRRPWHREDVEKVAAALGIPVETLYLRRQP
jgi:transcriptional regulator with XRE-family HTH domain